MQIDNQYHEASERECDSLFDDFATNSNIFKTAMRNPKYSKIDYTAVDKKNRFCNVELKKRECSTDTYSTTFIECEKAWELINKYGMKQYIPLYINFFNDGVLLFDLRKYDNPVTDLKYNNVEVIDKGYNNVHYRTWRMELPNTDAIKFKKINGKYVHIDGRQT